LSTGTGTLKAGQLVEIGVCGDFRVGVLKKIEFWFGRCAASK
jgi:hypothetical protein